MASGRRRPRLGILLKTLRRRLARLLRLLTLWGRRRARRPWHLRIGRSSKSRVFSRQEIARLLQRHRDLQDFGRIAAFAARFRLPESDYFADPQQVERLIQHFTEENPPWLTLSRPLPGGEPGIEGENQDILWREQEVRERKEMTLFVPDETWHDRPLASLTLQPARRLEEVWQARLLNRVLPPEILLDRFQRGEILIPVHQGIRQRLEFKPICRTVEITERRRVPVPIASEGGSGHGGQLLYFLLDYSASMQGKSAVLAIAVLAAVLRANLGQRNTRYLFRRYAEQMWPRVVEPPLQARTLAEKDALFDTLLATDFNGSATHVNDALEVALTDIAYLRREEQLEAGLLLVTDGRAEILESTRLKLRAAGIAVHTVMVTAEKNPGLESLSESFTALDIHPDSLPIRA